MTNKNIHVYNNDVLDLYDKWETPTAIISDGPYGISGFPGDPSNSEALPEWYEPHIQKWSEISTPQTTLWFWNTEIGWARVHPILEKYGWTYKHVNVWDKGIGHIAGNSNVKTLSKLPVVTEVCVQYVKKPEFKVEDKNLSMQEWLRYEWKRTGLPLSKTNDACGVKNAASRKYFTNCHLWYMPPASAFEKLVEYANSYGIKSGRPYFSIDGERPLNKFEWEKLRPKFNCPYGVTNVWNEPPIHGKERIKKGTKALHLNQKPLSLIERIIEMSTDEDDIVWEPFGGLFTGAVASYNLKRQCFSAEIDDVVYSHALHRVQNNMEILI